MIRRKPEFQSIDLSAWPSIAWTELDQMVCHRVRQFLADCLPAMLDRQHAQGVPRHGMSGPARRRHRCNGCRNAA